jgi:hypothetical protein
MPPRILMGGFLPPPQRSSLIKATRWSMTPARTLEPIAAPWVSAQLSSPSTTFPTTFYCRGLTYWRVCMLPSPVDVCGMSFMAAYLSSPAPGVLASVGGPPTSGSVGGPCSASPFVGGATVSGQPIIITSHAFSCGPSMGGASVAAQAFGGPPFGGVSIPCNFGNSPSGLGGVSLPPSLMRFTGLPGQPMGGPFFGAFSSAAFDSTPAPSLAAPTPGLPAPSSSSIARLSPAVHAYWSLHLAPGDLPPCSPSGVEPLHRPNPVEEVFLNESPSRSCRNLISSLTSRLRASPLSSFPGDLRGVIGRWWMVTKRGVCCPPTPRLDSAVLALLFHSHLHTHMVQDPLPTTVNVRIGAPWWTMSLSGPPPPPRFHPLRVGPIVLLHPTASRLPLPWSARRLLLHPAAFLILLPRSAQWLLVVPLLCLLWARAWTPRSLYRLIGSPSLPSRLGMTIPALATLSCSGSAPPAFPPHWMTQF